MTGTNFGQVDRTRTVTGIQLSSSETGIKSTVQKRDSKGVIRHGAEWLTLWSDPDGLKSVEDKRREQAEYQAEAQLRRVLTAASRSLSGDPGLQITIEDDDGNEPDLFLLSGSETHDDLSAIRGRLDAQALLARFHDAQIHAKFAPEDAARRRLFDMCEAVRCEAQGARLFPGVVGNLVAFHRQRLEKSDLLNAHLAALIPLGEGLRMVLRDTLLGSDEPSIPSSGFWMWDRWLRTRVGGVLRELSLLQGEQLDFALGAKVLIDAVLAELGGSANGMQRRKPSRRPSATDSQSVREQEPLTTRSEEGDQLTPSELFVDDDQELPTELLYSHDVDRPAYAIFSSEHDRIVRAETLGDPVALREARKKLDQKRAAYRQDFARLVTQLQRRLMARQNRTWTFDLEEGLIDASRLNRVVVNPGFSDAYKQEGETDFRNTVVTLLLDNSGSMRGKAIELTAIASDMVAAALEHCGVATEILGFTTSAWKGGESAKDWARAGRLGNPGRLNDLLHIVYKSADEPLRRARNNICAMLSPDVLKENVDGEGLVWAYSRLLLRPEQRKVLIVVSDGAPVDEATLQNNDDKSILDRHLRQVIGEIGRAGQVELAAIGIKHEVADYYPVSTRVESIDELGAKLVAMIDSLVVR